MKLQSRWFINFFFFIIPVIIIGTIFVFLSNDLINFVFRANLVPSVTFETNNNENVNSPKQNLNKTQKALLNPPKIIKAVYLTSSSAGRKNYVDYVIKMAKTTEINAVVIDIKDFSGNIAYNINLPQIESESFEPEIADIDSLITKLHKEGIYIIARIVVFQDQIFSKKRPDLAIHQMSTIPSSSNSLTVSSLWRDKAGLLWLDPASVEVWDYIIAICQDALRQGFDELNFDYVRFPSEGKLKDMFFPAWNETTPKHIVIKNFFRYLRQNLPNATLSVDIFGQATVNSDDLGIGQILEDTFDYFDFISPMVYPSHYREGFLGYKYPAAYPYEVISHSIENAKKRIKFYLDSSSGEQKIDIKLRPWLQDFNLEQDMNKGIIYSAEMVKLEINAVLDAMGEDFNGFMLWDPKNLYTKEALQPASPN